MPGIREVAKRAKTSTATVSRVLNQTGTVSEDTRKRVLEAVELLGYKPMIREGSLRETKTIALVVPDIENPFFGKMTKEITRIANGMRYNILLVNVGSLRNDGGEFLLKLIGQRIDGILYGSSYRSEDAVRQAIRNKIPIVLLDREIRNIEVDSISVNNEQAGYIAAEHLIELGHKHIAFIGGIEGMKISDDRQLGYRKALEAGGVPYREEYVAYGEFLMDKGYELADRLMREHPEITAILAANDLMGIGAVSCLTAKGYQVPQEVSVMGFDDIDLAAALTPSLSSVAYPLESMSRLAMESIFAQIEEKEEEKQCTVLYAKLIARESTCKPREESNE